MNTLNNVLIIAGLICMFGIFYFGTWALWLLNLWAWKDGAPMGSLATTLTLFLILKIIFLIQEKTDPSAFKS